MNPPASDAVGLMVLQLWTESPVQLRVRLTYTIDVRTGSSTSSYAATREDVLEQVGAWLDAFVTSQGDADVTPT